MLNLMCPSLSKNVYIEKIAQNNGEKEIFFVLDPDKPSWVFINRDGLKILDLCNGKHSKEQISQIISNKFQIDYKYSYDIVDSFLSNMEKNKILYNEDAEKMNNNKFRGIALEITGKCNLECVHCYLSAEKISARHDDEEDLSFEEIKQILEAVKKLGGVSVALSGGEPLLRDDWLDIISCADSLDLMISLGSNGTLIDGEMAELISNYPVKIQISLDGATKEVHDLVRGAGSFKRAVKGIDHLVDVGMAKDMVIAFTPMKINYKEINSIIDFALEREIPVIQFPPLSPSGRAKEKWDELKLSSEETFWTWELLSKRSSELRGRLDLLADCFSINLNNPGNPHRCSIGTQLRVDPKGNVYPCQCFNSGNEYCLGNLKKTNLNEMVLGQKIQEIKKICFQRPMNIKECEDCNWKNFCGSGCMGNAYELNGDVLKPESCEIRKKWIDKFFEKKIDGIKQ